MTAKLAEAVIGFRLWDLHDGQLAALGGEIWPRGEMAAGCRHGRGHAPPHDGCGCGIYALHEVPKRLPTSYLFGAVVAWGSILSYFDGFRAQHARPVALAIPDEDRTPELMRLARHHDLAVVAPEALEQVAAEFGGPVPWSERGVDHAALLRRLTTAIARREKCWGGADLLDGDSDAFAHSVLGLLAREKREHAPLAPALLSAWRSRKAGRTTASELSRGLERLREAVVIELEGRPKPDEADALLGLLAACHGDVGAASRRRLHTGASSDVAAEYALQSADARELPQQVLERGQELLADDKPLPHFNIEASLLPLIPRLSDDALTALLPRVRSGRFMHKLLDRAGTRSPMLARQLLASPGSLGTERALDVLGPGCRPLLIRKLRTTPWPFARCRNSALRSTVGASELRLAAERAMRDARDPVDTVRALALLPGDEARDKLRVIALRSFGLRPDAGGQVMTRTWSSICSVELAGLLDTDLVQRAVNNRRLYLADRIVLLRTHPAADPQAAMRLWRSECLTPRFASDVLRACQAERPHLVEEELRQASAALTDNQRATRLAAVMAMEGNGSSGAREVAQAMRDEPAAPASLRAIGAWVLGDGGATRDAPMRRYRSWLAESARCEEPLVALLSGAWMHGTSL